MVIGYLIASIILAILSFITFGLFSLFVLFILPAVIGYIFVANNFEEGFKRAFNYFNISFIKAHLNTKYLIYSLIFNFLVVPISYIVILIASFTIILLPLVSYLMIIVWLAFSVASVNYGNLRVQ